MIRRSFAAAGLMAILAGCGAEPDGDAAPQSDVESPASPEQAGDDEQVAEFVPYPEPVKREFLKSCLASGATQEVCDCTFTEFEAYLTLEEFMQFETRMTVQQSTEDDIALLSEIRYTCVQ